MRIRTQLIFAIAILVTALLVIAGSVIVTNQQVDRLSKQEVLAKNIETEANDLTYLSSDYVLYPDSYQAEQWQSKYLALASDLSVLTVDTPEQQVLVNNLKANQRRLKNVFDDVESSMGNTSSGYPAIDPLATRISWGRLTVQTQGIIADSGRLSQLLNDEIEQVKMLGNLLIFLMMGTFSLFILSSYLIVYRRTLNSIEVLRNGTKIIGSGDLNHVIPEKGDDEIRDLSRAFNKMTVNLRGVTASKADLEREGAERNRTERALRESEENYRNLVKYAPAAIYEMDIEGTKFLDVNEVMCDTLGYSKEELLHVNPADLLDEKSKVLFRERIREKLAGGKIGEAAEYRIRRKDGVWIYTDIRVGSFTYTGDKPSRVVVIGHDITERIRAQEALKEALTEKDILLSEIHHRVKNNLAAFISLLSLGGSYEETPEGQSLKKDLQNRARSMALIHETLYQTRKFSKVDMGVYLTTLVGQIAGSYSTVIRTIVCAEGVNIDIARATPCGLIINELITNSFKYAFPESYDCRAFRGEPCTIRVSLVNEEGIYSLSVSDNGIGLPQKVDPRSTQTLGLKLVYFLARHQLRANVVVDTSAGTIFMIRFKEQG